MVQAGKPGDYIVFVSDTYADWPFPGDHKEPLEFTDMTDKVIASLIDAKILVDQGIAWADKDEPDAI